MVLDGLDDVIPIELDVAGYLGHSVGFTNELELEDELEEELDDELELE